MFFLRALGSPPTKGVRGAGERPASLPSSLPTQETFSSPAHERRTGRGRRAASEPDSIKSERVRLNGAFMTPAHRGRTGTRRGSGQRPRRHRVFPSRYGIISREPGLSRAYGERAASEPYSRDGAVGRWRAIAP